MNEPLEQSTPHGPWERRSRSIGFAILVLALGVLAGMGAREADSRGSAWPQQGDARQALALSPEQRDALLKDMRGMLGAMQGVLEAAARMDVQKMRGMAQAAGVAMSPTREEALREQLPESYRKQDVETHAAFDALAEAIRGFTARDTALAYLSRISARCVACHAQYRYTTKE